MWMAPEMFSAGGEPSFKTDIFSLSVVMYEVRETESEGERPAGESCCMACVYTARIRCFPGRTHHFATEKVLLWARCQSMRSFRLFLSDVFNDDGQTSCPDDSIGVHRTTW